MTQPPQKRAEPNRLKAANKKLLTAVITIANSYWTDGEPHAERVEDLQKIARGAVYAAALANHGDQANAMTDPTHHAYCPGVPDLGLCTACACVAMHLNHQIWPAREIAASAAEADPGAIDLEAVKAHLEVREPLVSDIVDLIAAVEALRKRVAELEAAALERARAKQESGT